MAAKRFVAGQPGGFSPWRYPETNQSDAFEYSGHEKIAAAKKGLGSIVRADRGHRGFSGLRF